MWDGDGVVGESLSSAEAFSATDRCRGIMSSPASRDNGALMLAREESKSSRSCELFVGARTAIVRGGLLT